MLLFVNQGESLFLASEFKMTGSGSYGFVIGCYYVYLGCLSTTNSIGLGKDQTILVFSVGEYTVKTDFALPSFNTYSATFLNFVSDLLASETTLSFIACSSSLIRFLIAFYAISLNASLGECRSF